jgi:hypothetical protein
MPEINLSENLKKELQEKMEQKFKQKRELAQTLFSELRQYFGDVEVFVNKLGIIIVQITEESFTNYDFETIFNILNNCGCSGPEFTIYPQQKDRVGITFFV